MDSKEALRLAVQTFAGNNDVVYDVRDKPSIMVRIPRFRIGEVMDGGGDEIHPAFVVNGRVVEEIYLSKYEASMEDGLAYSLPARLPAGEITFDEAIAACEGKGPGWHLMTNAEWAAILLWCRKNGTVPQGNVHFGKELEPVRSAIPADYGVDDEAGKIARVLTGTGPLNWTHDGTPGGIWGLRGNLVQMIGGIRTSYGEIQVIPDNDAAVGADQAPNSRQWRAILQDGSLVVPGTPGTLKVQYVEDAAENQEVIWRGVGAGGKWVITTEVTRRHEGSQSGDFHRMAAAPGVVVPDILKTLLLFPADEGKYGGRIFLDNAAPDQIFNRADAHHALPGGGAFYYSGRGDRNRRLKAVGFRLAYVPPA
ncbi:hypothetical protein [Microbacterium sp.]|uniref:hypothetical protein n=1 Tax=Microbacterium sp. TaxID=51671 RepID=UPI0039E6912E